jgi:hypothetical protein
VFLFFFVFDQYEEKQNGIFGNICQIVFFAFFCGANVIEYKNMGVDDLERVFSGHTDGFV